MKGRRARGGQPVESSPGSRNTDNGIHENVAQINSLLLWKPLDFLVAVAN